MKIIKSQRRNKKSYFVTLSVSDYDIEMLEDLATCYCYPEAKRRKNPIFITFYVKYNKWLLKTFSEFQKLWKKYDQ